MASTAESHLPALGSHVREEVGRELQLTLVSLVDLTLVGKQLHWSIVGPRFNPLHQRLDELVDSWHELADKVAERAVALGHFPDGQADAIVAAGDRSPLEPGAIEDQAVLAEVVRRVSDVAEEIRARMDRLGELDLVTQDLLIGIVGELEEQLWMTRSQLQS
jgi:starvation-inducible DNA-binding protein